MTFIARGPGILSKQSQGFYTRSGLYCFISFILYLLGYKFGKQVDILPERV
jgi:hypothetical protein